MKSNLFIAEQFRDQACCNIDQGINLWHLINHVIWANIPGDIVELGCLSGRTAAMLGKTLQEAGDDRTLFLYDSFEGLPQPDEDDGPILLIPENFKTPKEGVAERFQELGLRQPNIIPGWFCDTLPDQLPEVIAFAHVDGDIYRSIQESLNAIYPRLSPGAVVVVDDYCDDDLSRRIEEAYNNNSYHLNPYGGEGDQPPSRKYYIGNWLPSVKRACEEFLADKPEEMTLLIAGEEKHGLFRKVS